MAAPTQAINSVPIPLKMLPLAQPAATTSKFAGNTQATVTEHNPATQSATATQSNSFAPVATAPIVTTYVPTSVSSAQTRALLMIVDQLLDLGHVQNEGGPQ